MVGELASQVRGVSFKKDDASNDPRTGTIGIVRAGGIVDGELELDDLVYVPAEKVKEGQMLRRGDVLIATSSGSLDVVGKAARIREDAPVAFGAFCKVLRPGAQVDPGYFAHFFQTRWYRSYVSSVAAGANINNLKNSHLDNIEMPLPPMDEQRRIAAVLDAADALRAKRRQALAKLDTLTQAIFLDMFRDDLARPLVPLRGFFSEPPIFGTMMPGREEGSWLDLRVANIQKGRLELSDRKYVNLASKDIGRHSVRDGDVLLARAIATLEQLGKCIVVRSSGGRWAFDSHLMRIRLDEARMSPDFLQAWLSTAPGRAEFLRIARRSSVQFNVNTKEIARLAVPEVPIERQAAFEALVGQLERQRSRCVEHLNDLEQLFASLQQRAFRGES